MTRGIIGVEMLQIHYIVILQQMQYQWQEGSK